ncbi:MAG TPA: hypothetical protein VKF40_30365 [Burkholderiales bacterium]|nr:hypothetical protein [Burkholderiales bacterium]
MKRSISRRDWLARTAAGGAALALGMSRLRQALAADAVAKGVATVRGDARINGEPARQGMALGPGDTITTAGNAELVAVVGRDAFMVRADTQIELVAGRSGGAAIGIARVVTGGLLAVFGPGEARQVRTASANIGIRGTGVYVEAEANRTYVCTCYGRARLTPVDDPKAAETVRTRHHDQPRYIYPKGMPRRIEKAPVVNHTDAELVLLESLVGRKVPFTPGRY